MHTTVSQDLRSGILGSTNYISNRYHWSRFFHLSIPSDSSHPTWASTPSPNTAVCRCESRARSKGPARTVFSSALWLDLARHRFCLAHRLGAAVISDPFWCPEKLCPFLCPHSVKISGCRSHVMAFDRLTQAPKPLLVLLNRTRWQITDKRYLRLLTEGL
jgi:hypothetical protein